MRYEKFPKQYPSMVHHIICSSKEQLTPLDHCLSEDLSDEMRNSCIQLHEYVEHLLSDMYDAPEEYGFPVHVLEDFVGSSTVNGMKQKYPSKTKTILSHTRNSVDRYMFTLSLLAYEGTLENDTLVVPKEVYAAIDKKVNTSTSPISLEQRLTALERTGLIETEQGFVCKSYPQMFLSLCTLSQKTKGKSSGFPYFLYSKLDFRNITSNYKPVPSDYFSPLSEDRKYLAYKIHDLLIKAGCKPKISTFFKVEYKYKGKQVIQLDTAESTLRVRITDAYAWEEHDEINEKLKMLPIEDQKEALRHVWRCTACSTSHLGMFVTILGHKCRVCGGGQIAFNWEDPVEKEISLMEKLWNMRLELVDNQ